MNSDHLPVSKSRKWLIRNKESTLPGLEADDLCKAQLSKGIEGVIHALLPLMVKIAGRTKRKR